MEDLFDKLLEYSQSDVYPFHMPGHKRKALTEERSYSIDITEIDGFDNLHHPEGILREINKTAAALYETVESRLLVNGSTCGILTAISACCSYGGKILVARNCHKAVYHGILLRGLKPVYVYPAIEPEFGLNGSIALEAVKEALEANQDAQAVLLTSPTYDGVVSDIEKISEIVHAYGLPLIVDEAHGAHLSFCQGIFPESALKKGADIVIHSLHKTLPAFTQTALFHINSHRVDSAEITKYLDIYQSSSPSYILMAGAGSCLKWLQQEGPTAFKSYEERLLFWRKQYCALLSGTERVKLVDYCGTEGKRRHAVYDCDPSKLIFSTGKGDLSGEELYQIFREKYRLQMEMATGTSVLALSSVCDSEEGFQRLYDALAEEFVKESGERKQEKKRRSGGGKGLESGVLPEARQIFTLSEAEKMKKKAAKIEDSVGFISASALYLYPPGIPFLLPGEEITEEIVRYVQKIQGTKLKVRGLLHENRILLLEREP